MENSPMEHRNTRSVCCRIFPIGISFSKGKTPIFRGLLLLFPGRVDTEAKKQRVRFQVTGL